MDIVDALLGEHGAIRALLGHAAEIASSGSSAEVLATISLLERVLLSHADIEEDLLLPSMVDEHRLGHSEHQEIRGWLDVQRSPVNPATLLATAVDLTRLHLEREEAGLFRVARERLSAEERQRLGTAWAAVRQVHLSKER